MKIGLVLDDTLDTPDGVQQYVLQVGKWLSAQGHNVHYLVGATLRTDIPNVHSLSRNVHVKFNGNRMSMPLPTSRRRLRAFLTTEQFDVLHVQVPYSPFMAGRLISAAPSSTAIIGTFHILPYSPFAGFVNHFLKLLNHRSGKRFDQMLAVSEPAAQFARKVYGYQVQIGANPIEVSRFSRATSDNPDLNIVFLGRLVTRKGAGYLLQAIAYLREQHLCDRAFKVYIGGKGELHSKLEAFVATHQLQDIVTLAGFIDEKSKPTFLAQADIVAYPSTGGESFGIVLLEAMAASRGVVLAGNNPGYASVMAPYPDQLFEPQDLPAFAALLARYLQDTEARQKASKAQKDYVRQFDIDIVGAHLLATYKAALQSRAKS